MIDQPRIHKPRFGSKAKGADYERSVCTRLSMWVTNNIRKDSFWRSAMSGGRAKVGLKRGDGSKFAAQAGDVVATHETGNLLISLFVVECKSLKSLDIATAFFGKLGVIGRVWNTLELEAKSFDKLPLGIFKQNHKPEIVCTNYDGWLLLRRGGLPRLMGICGPGGPHVMLFREMLATVDFDKIRQYIREGTEADQMREAERELFRQSTRV